MDIQELNERSRDIFRIIVETYLDSGEPVGSRTISRFTGIDLSSASIRNVMSDLEEFGLLSSPHTSAGRLPTEAGLRLFVDGLLEVGVLTRDQRSEIESRCAVSGRRSEEVLAEATQMLSGLSHCASLVVAPKQNAPLKQMEFIYLEPGRGLVVLVFENGSVENRVIELPPGLPPSALVKAANYLNARLAGRTFEDLSYLVEVELAERQAELDSLTAKVVASGLATWAGGSGEGAESSLIVRGRANLLEEEAAAENLERIRQLFDDLETKKELLRLLDMAREGSGVKIFIGAETNLFSLSGSSVIVSPYMNGAGEIVGVVGVIGPTRLNYARIIPMVDYTAQVIGKIL